ncbi:hypothetical protein DXG01_015331, partial [Tephrocybe rancida]
VPANKRHTKKRGKVLRMLLDNSAVKRLAGFQPSVYSATTTKASSGTSPTASSLPAPLTAGLKSAPSVMSTGLTSPSVSV